MIEDVFLRFHGKRAVGTMIGGMIILTILLTVLGTMVFVSQQYDRYQQIANRMTQYRQQQELENLVANYPGLVANPGWNGCNGCNMYNMTLSNLGGVGVQITAVYITSIGSGCISLCVLNPSPSSTSYAFKQSTQFLNSGETNHAVLLYLPSTVSLPNTVPATNTILIVTSRGNEFSFQWPFQTQVGGQSTSAFSAGIMKVAYQCSTCGTAVGYDSKNEPGLGGTGTRSTGYCHAESSSDSTSERPQQFTGITLGGSNIGDSGTLWFVNPWVTQTILCTAAPGVQASNCSSCSTCTNQTTIYLYVNITNTGTTAYTPVAGSLDLTWYGSNHIDGNFIGMYYNNAFVSISATNPPTVPCATCGSSSPDYFYGIFRATVVTLDVATGGTWPPPSQSSVMFFGSLSLTDNLETGYPTPFVGGTALSSGLWIRYQCT